MGANGLGWVSTHGKILPWFAVIVGVMMILDHLFIRWAIPKPVLKHEA